MSVFALLISPIIVIVLSGIGMKSSENNYNTRLIFSIITLCLAGVTILMGVAWFMIIPTISTGPEDSIYLTGIRITVVIAIFVQIMVGGGAVLNIIFK